MNRVTLVLLSLLLLALVSGFLVLPKTAEPDYGSQAKQIERNLHGVLESLDQEASGLAKSLTAGRPLPTTQFQYVVFQNDDIVQWTEHHFIPSPSQFEGDEKLKLIKIGASDLLMRKWSMDDGKILAAIIPLYTHYRISNQYLTPQWNQEIFNNKQFIVLEPESNRGYPVSVNQEVIFRIQPGEAQTGMAGSLLPLILFSVALAILAVLVYRYTVQISHKRSVLAFFVLAAAIIAIRSIMVYIEFPARFIQSPLFDASYFAASEWNPSLGDMVFNSLCIFLLCLYLFKNYFKFGWHKLTGFSRWILSAVSSALVLFGMLYTFVVIQTIYNNSNLTLSIAHAARFDILRWLAFAVLMFSWLSAFMFGHIFVRIAIRGRNLLTSGWSILSGTAIFIAINTVSGQNYWSSLIIGVIYFLVVAAFGLSRSLFRFQYLTFVYFFVALLAHAINGSIAVSHFEQQRQVQRQFRFANNFLIDRDYFAEFLLQDAITRIETDAFIQSRMVSPFLSKDPIRQKIAQVFLTGYLNKYNIAISLFDAGGKPMDGMDTTALYSLLKRYGREAFKTGYEKVFLVTGEENEYSRKYVGVSNLKRSDVTIGFVTLELALKRIIPENVYPDLLVDNRFQSGYFDTNLRYAVITNDEIKYSSGDFNYENLLTSHDLSGSPMFTSGLTRDGYLHVAVSDSPSTTAIVSSKQPAFVFRLADFSLQVLMGFAIVLMVIFIQGVFNFRRSQNLFLAARIQLVLNLAFFVPLIAVSVITLSLTSQTSQDQLSNDYLEKSKRFANTLIALSDSLQSTTFSSEFGRLTALSNLDGNVYTADGRLVVSSQPLMVDQALLSTCLDARVLHRFRHGDKAFIATEQIGNLKFYVAYAALLSARSGDKIGILAIPFYQSASSLERLQITVLSNILSIFTLIFIVLILISFLVSRWLTSPFAMITKTLGRISLVRENKPLEWNSEDEIGIMVKEYNQMLGKLQESKQELERNQRERAWREIAQQVAHEIKNPLTPMKLTLQQLERSDADQSKEKLTKALQALLVQVNSLDNIASSFSSFAKMPEPVMKPVELVKLLSRVVSIYAQEGNIEFKTSVSAAPMVADEQILVRVFSNIILNGLQAIAQPSGKVVIELSPHEGKYRIIISDNGPGIENRLAEKIFLPHFTTKKSGSGLGLAIAKQGIEQMGGTIWFTTGTGGTTFYIELMAS